jgi:hypothetical protein
MNFTYQTLNHACSNIKAINKQTWRDHMGYYVKEYTSRTRKYSYEVTMGATLEPFSLIPLAGFGDFESLEK